MRSRFVYITVYCCSFLVFSQLAVANMASKDEKARVEAFLESQDETYMGFYEAWDYAEHTTSSQSSSSRPPKQSALSTPGPADGQLVNEEFGKKKRAKRPLPQPVNVKIKAMENSDTEASDAETQRTLWARKRYDLLRRAVKQEVGDDGHDVPSSGLGVSQVKAEEAPDATAVEAKPTVAPTQMDELTANLTAAALRIVLEQLRPPEVPGVKVKNLAAPPEAMSPPSGPCIATPKPAMAAMACPPPPPPKQVAAEFGPSFAPLPPPPPPPPAREAVAEPLPPRVPPPPKQAVQIQPPPPRVRGFAGTEHEGRFYATWFI